MFKTLRRLSRFGETFAAACRVSNDIERHRRPDGADLETLGIDANRFPRL